MTPELIPRKQEVKSQLEYRQEESDFDTLRAIEQDEFLQNHENIGYNITDALLIRPARMEGVAKAQALVDALGEEAAFEELSAQYGKDVNEVRHAYETVIDEEMQKVESTFSLIEQMPDGASMRVHPFPPESPFSMKNCRHEEDGTAFFSFDPIALEQMRALYDKCNAGEKPGELSVVMNSYTTERGGDIPKTEQEIQEYAQMCISFLEQMNLRESGGVGICLELGNETNVGLDTRGRNGEQMFKNESFAKTVDAQVYAHMYARVASMIKSEFPNVEIAIAGTAMFDDAYLEEVITTVTADNGGQTGLIDKISFHPYRSTCEQGTVTFANGPDGKVCVESPLDYAGQCARMAELTQLAGAKRFDVGEVSFVNWGADGRTINTSELHKNSANCKQKGLKSYIWPGDQIVQYG